MKNRIVSSLFMLALITLACSIPTAGRPAEQAPTETPQASATPSPVPTPPAEPVSISEGLASLNSYRTILSIKSTGPDADTSSNLVIESQRSNDQEAQYTHITSASIEEGQPSEGDGDSEVYRIGNDECTVSDEEASYTSRAANEAEMMDLALGMFTFSPAIDNPVFVAQETVNGVSTNHFSFKVEGLGVKSGANVTMNQGDYWLAVDGQYIVKYSLIAETVMDPQTNIVHMETVFEVNDINLPVTIAFPESCVEASQATPSATP
jgi:hypothetical protein